MKKLKVLDLFSGIGGFSLGLERTGGFETVAFCEIEEFPRRVLKKHWPEVPCYHDVTKLTGDILQRDGISVDVITGGFPCQAFSSAARGRNNAPDLWPEMARLVSEIKPRFAIAENVKRAPIERAADHFCGLGMQCDVIHIPAYEVGADHERSRWWAVAHPYENGEFSRAFDAEAQKLPEIRGSIWGPENYRRAVCLSDGFPSGLGAGSFGNAVVPIAPQLIGVSLLKSEELK
jgi:DNA (cytosine-5)-methyltransferase 1